MFYYRLFATYLRLGVLRELEYRANFWINLLQSLLELGVALGGLAVVFAHTDNLGGWRPEELLGAGRRLLPHRRSDPHHDPPFDD